MRATRRSPDEQFQLIMECRQSGLSDQVWCLQHDINPGTFWNWVKRLRQRGYTIPDSYSKKVALVSAQEQEVVKLDLLPEHASSFAQENACIPFMPETSKVETLVAIEIQLNNAIIRIPNGTDEKLVHAVLYSIGGGDYAR